MRDGLWPPGGQGLRRAECSNHRRGPCGCTVAVYLRRLRDSTVVGGVLHVARCGSSWPLLEIESSRGESPLTRLVGRIPANGVTVMAGRSTWLRAVLATAVAAPIQRPQGLGYTVESVRGGLLESCFLTEILDCTSVRMSSMLWTWGGTSKGKRRVCRSLKRSCGARGTRRMDRNG